MEIASVFCTSLGLMTEFLFVQTMYKCFETGAPSSMNEWTFCVPKCSLIIYIYIYIFRTEHARKRTCKHLMQSDKRANVKCTLCFDLDAKIESDNIDEYALEAVGGGDAVCRPYDGLITTRRRLVTISESEHTRYFCARL
jgi:hypothetical protein